MEDSSGDGEGDNGCEEGDIFLADEDHIDPIDPTQSLNFLRRQHLQQMAGRGRRQGSDEASSAEGGKKGEEEEDKLNELRTPQWSVEGFSEEEDQSYKFGLQGSTPPKGRIKRKSKLKCSGKDLSCEPRIVASHEHSKKKQQRTQSMTTLPNTTTTSSKPSKPSSSSKPSSKHKGESPSHGSSGYDLHARRHTIHDATPSSGKKERRHRHRTLSPQHSNDENSSNSNTLKSSKKQKKINRGKDRDDKSDLHQLQPEPRPTTTSPPPHIPRLTTTSPPPHIPRASSIGGTADEYRPPSALDYAMPQRSVTESLNPSIMNRKAVIEEPHGRLRRTNSDAQFTLTTLNGVRERRCPPDRKQFYRQFIKSIKFYGINSTAANRMETPAPSHIPRFHSENLASANPYSPIMDKLWMELQAFLRDRTAEQHEEWLFFYQTRVHSVLNRIIYYYCSCPSSTQSVSSLSMPSREGYEALHGSYSSPALNRKAMESERASFVSGGWPTLTVSTVPREQQACCAPPSGEATPTAATLTNGESDDSTHTTHCVVEHDSFLSPLQQKAMVEVSCILKDLDEVESQHMNRKRMGDEYPKYRTPFFKRRVAALNIWDKVTHGLAENLCQLSNWMGVPVHFPEICVDDHVVLEEVGVFTSEPLEPLLEACPSDSPKTPRPQSLFSVGTPDTDVEESLSKIRRGLPHIVTQGSLVQSEVQSSSRTESSSSQVTAGLQRIISRESHHEPYRDFVSRILKRKGIGFMVARLEEFMSPILRLAKFALNTETKETTDTDLYEDFSEEERKPLLMMNMKRFMAPGTFDAQPELPPHLIARGTSVESQNWLDEFAAMNLPSFSMQYIQLIHVPLDVMRECLKLQMELEREIKSPSPHTVKQLADECREILKYAIEVRESYRQNIEAILVNAPLKAEQVEADLEGFETDMKNVLKVYFRYLKTWVNLSSGHVLEEEWRNVKHICTSIRGGEAEAGRKFCDMVTQLLESMGDDLDQKMDDCCSEIIKKQDDPVDSKDLLTQSSRNFKELFVGLRERANRVLGFAKILRKDLEIAADFLITTNIPELFSILKASDHVRVTFPHYKLEKMIFVPEGTSENPKEIHQLLNVSFAHGSSDEHMLQLKESYILLANVNVMESQSAWSGKTVEIQVSTETTINLSELQVDSLKMVVANSANLAECRSSFMSAVGKAVSLVNERTSSHENVAERIKDLKDAACELAKRLMGTANKVMDYLSMDSVLDPDDHNSAYQSAMHACFNLGFEYVREVFRLLGDDLAFSELGEQALDYALLWIRFVLEKCDRGRGTRPRWATTGLEFMIVACAPTTLATISQSRFEVVKKLMNRCVDHVIGEAPPTSAVIPEGNNTLTRIGRKNKKSWMKPRQLPFGRLGFSFTGRVPHVEDEEDTTSVFKLPQSKFDSEKNGGGDPVPHSFGPLKVEEPPVVAIGDPSRLETAAHIYKGGVDAVDSESVVGASGNWAGGHNGASGRGYFRQASPLSTIPSKSPPNSTESLEPYSSGVDSPPSQSTDLSSSSTTARYTTAYQSSVPPAYSHPTGHDPPLVMTTPTSGASMLSPMERMDSAGSTGSATSANRYYHSPSSLSHSLSRSDSGGSTSSSSITMDRSRRIQEEIKVFELNHDKTLRSKRRIGQVRKVQVSARRDVGNLTNIMKTNFKWQRGRKLGEGRFGKVYECWNLTTGEINAVKQISIQEKDTSAIQAIIDEISNFQKLRNDYVVKFYGVEVHHNELYMFMEYCNEGTLWTIAQQGLTDQMTRHYTRDILLAVDTMHTCGIVHRDIKGANIFLSSNGSIKLGDFGLSVQLKNYNMTMPNEIKQQAGTVPYMAPEVILKRAMGRPMDIWSVGCVVIEMATGKLPWAEHDNQFTIMYQLGSGQRPQVNPKSSLSDDGHRFLDKCFTLDVKERPTAIDLLSEPFVQVS